MTGLVDRTGRSIRLVRTTLDASVLLVGFLLGGTVGIGTVVFALAIGPLVQFSFPGWPRLSTCRSTVVAEQPDRGGASRAGLFRSDAEAPPSH